MPNPKIESEKSVLEAISAGGLENCFIVRNPALERILFNRNVIGLEFTHSCESATKAFLLHLESELNQVAEDSAELMILTKGMYYWMHNAYEQAFGKNLQINYVSTNRLEISENNSVRVGIWTSNFDAPAKTLILGDTIASGATICAALSHYIKQHTLERVFIFSIVGSLVGGKVIAQFCKLHNIELTLVYGLAAFGLAPNGFDLSFLHPDTITSNEYRERAQKAFCGKPISSAGWDFGTQAQAIRKYRMLCWIEEKYWQLENTDVFHEKEIPTDWHLVEKEQAAYKDIIHKLNIPGSLT